MSKELETLVEKVAQALRDDWHRRSTLEADEAPDWNSLSEISKRPWLIDAKTAIRAVAEATREPSPAVILASHLATFETIETWAEWHAASPLGEALRDVP